MKKIYFALILIFSTILPVFCMNDQQSNIFDLICNQAPIEDIQSVVDRNPGIVISRDEDGCTPLHYAAYMNGDDTSILEVLFTGLYRLKNGLNLVDVVDNENMTPLMYAATNNCFNVIQYLVERGLADVTIQSNQGQTARDATSITAIRDYLENAENPSGLK